MPPDSSAATTKPPCTCAAFPRGDKPHEPWCAWSAARDRYDTAKFTDHEIEDELGNVPPRHRSDAYLDALRAERDRRSQDRGPRSTRSSEVGSVPDNKEGTDGGHGTSAATVHP